MMLLPFTGSILNPDPGITIMSATIMIMIDTAIMNNVMMIGIGTIILVVHTNPYNH